MPTKTTLSGVVNIDKPAGLTSHDVVAQVRSLLRDPKVGLPAEARRAKVGHTGTLDPFATGVLLVVVGSATRLIQFSHASDKEYEATFTLGATSDTDDVTGVITKNQLLISTKQPSKTNIQTALKNFVGEIEQHPPAYSAVKIKGKKLYEYAREKTEVGEIKPRHVTIHAIEVIEYTYPSVRLRITCSTGTYIRSLARDVGAALGVGAYVSSLRRTRIGHFEATASVKIEKLSTGIPQHMHSPTTLVSHLPSLTLTSHNIDRLRQGQGVGLPSATAGINALFDKDHVLIGVGSYDPASSLLSPMVNL